MNIFFDLMAFQINIQGYFWSIAILIFWDGFPPKNFRKTILELKNVKSDLCGPL